MNNAMIKISRLALAGLMTCSLAGALLAAPVLAASSEGTLLAQGGAGAGAGTGAPKGLKGAETSMKTFSGQAGVTTQGDLTVITGKVIRGFLGLLGTVFVVLTIYAGFLWMTASGNEEQITKAKKMITNAVIGIIIVVLAYVVTDFVFKALTSATSGAGDAAPPSG